MYEVRSYAAVWVLAAAFGVLAGPADAESINTSPRQTHVLNSGKQFLALESWDRIGLFDMASGAKKRTFLVPTRYINSFALSLDGQVLAVAGSGGLWTYDFCTGKQLANVSSSQYLHGVSLSGDGKLVAAAFNRGGVRIYDSRSGALKKHMDTKGELVLSVALSPDGARGALVTLDERVKMFDVAEGTYIGEAVEGAWPIRFSNDGKYIAMRSNNSDDRVSLRLLDTSTRKTSDFGEFNDINKLRSVEDGFILVDTTWRSQTSKGYFLNSKSKELEMVWSLQTHAGRGVDFLPDGSIGIVTDFKVDTVVRNLKSGTVLYEIWGRRGAVHSPTEPEASQEERGA